MRRALRAGGLLIVTLSLSGCYLLQAASGQMGVLSRSRPIDAAIADPATPPATREGLRLAVRARAFAVEQLGLPDGRSYRKSADLGRPYAVWNVVATPEFSIRPTHWCFPIAGCVSYRGYFKEASARAFALKMSARGQDVTVDGVPTYSTLGHFPDPLFSTMLGWREARLVGTIFHELAHERLYVAGDTEFNEAFASVVEDEGVRRWLTDNGRSSELEAYRLAAVREAEFSGLIETARERAARLYRSGLAPAEMRVEKERAFGRLKFEYEQLRERWGGYRGYDGWFARPLNNAHLAAVATYQDCVPGLRRELDAAGSLRDFYRRAEALAGLDRAARHARVCAGAG